VVARAGELDVDLQVPAQLGRVVVGQWQDQRKVLALGDLLEHRSSITAKAATVAKE